MIQPRSTEHGASVFDRGVAPERGDFVRRALLLWPRLDRRRLRRISQEPIKIARLVARRTNLSVETIQAMIVGRTGAVGGPVRGATSRKVTLVLLGRTPPVSRDAQAHGQGRPTPHGPTQRS